MAQRGSKEKYKVPSVGRAFKILDLLSMSSVGLTKTQIAKELRIPYSTTFNLLQTMEQFGYVRRLEQLGSYVLGLKLLNLGSLLHQNFGLKDSAAPNLERLVRVTGLTAHLAILEQRDAVYILKKEPTGYFKINSWIGKRNYSHSSAVGKALLSRSSQTKLRALCEKGLRERTPKTITSYEELRKELAKIRKAGYAVDDEEDELGGRGDASPILNASGAVIAAVGLSGLTAQVSKEELPRLGALVKESATEISRQQGHLREPE